MAYDELVVRSAAQRFWDGTSSLEDEALLRTLAREGELPDDLEGIAAYFEAIEEEPVLGSDFDEVLLDQLEDRKKVFTLSSRSRLLAVAAMLVAVMSAWWIFREANETETITAEYSQEEVQEAWEQTQEALRKLSKGMNEGAERAATIQKLNQAQYSISNH